MKLGLSSGVRGRNSLSTMVAARKFFTPQIIISSCITGEHPDLFFFSFIFIHFLNLFIFYFTILYWFCHTLTWIRHRCTCVLHPEPSSHLPPHRKSQGHPSAPALSTLYHASNLDRQSVSHMIIYMFQCHSPKPSHPHPLPQSPKDYSIHLCLFCCLAYRVIITVFLNSIYMC